MNFEIKMPLFTNKFTPKKTPPRKMPSLSTVHQEFDAVKSQEEFGLNYGPIKLHLGDSILGFAENGEWHIEKEGSVVHLRDDEDDETVTKLEKQNLELIEENNLLKLKLEILYNMLAETTAEVHLQEKEIEDLKEELRKK